MNVVILANILMGLGLIFGLWRGQAFYFALIFIILFIIMVGAPPSALRAGIMGGVVLFAQKAGRLSQAQRLLIIAATLMLAFNPLLLKFDIGFQLSFLATLGIAKLYPYLNEKLSFIPKKLDILEIKSTVAMTIPAVIFTAPILAYNFGQLSIVSIFTNILVVPTLGFAFGLGFFAAIAGIIFHPLGQIFFWPVWLLLEYAYRIIEWSAKIPFAVMEIEVFPWYMSALYFALLWWGIKYFKLER
jgi:competence protein ComEC